MSDSPVQHFLRIPDMGREELVDLLGLAAGIKAGQVGERSPLDRKSLAMIFHKSSTRTRVSFEVGMFELGGHAVFLSDQDSQMGRGEEIADTARVLSRYVDGIMVRTFRHADLEELARHASVPVINGLTDLFHPCQVLADILTAVEELDLAPEDLSSLRVAWVGDGNNVAHSWINAASVLGFELVLACPEGYGPDPAVLGPAGADGERVRVVPEPEEAVAGARVVTTDVWASMGQEDEAEVRARAFRDYRVTGELMSGAAADAVFLHCLPAHRGEEVDAAVIDGERSRVFEEAENRLHVQKALLLTLMG